MVMSLVSFIGPKPNLLDTNNINPPMRLEVSQPVLDFKDIAKIRASTSTRRQVRAYELNICYPVAWGKEGIEARLASLCAEAVDAVKSGYNILIVSDRKTDADHVAIPALLATSAIHQHLVQQGLRTTGLVVETGSARETHHFALLAGYGAEAVHPYLAMETLAKMAEGLPGDLSPRRRSTTSQGGRQGPAEGDVEDGHLDVHVVHGAQIFEASACRATSSRSTSRHGIEGRRHRRVRGRGRSDPPAPRCVRRQPGAARHARRRRRVRLPRARRRPHVDAGFDRQAAARDAQQLVPDVQGIRALINDQTKRHMTLRGLFEFKVDPTRDPARRRRAGQGNRQALRHGRDVARLDQHRSARDAGDRDEPHRRQVEHRRRRRGRRYRNELRGIPIKRARR
jgi:glutamate synthase (ferredoxin)